MVVGWRSRQRGWEELFGARRAHVGVVVVAAEGEFGFDGAEASSWFEGGFLGEHVLLRVLLVLSLLVSDYDMVHRGW